MEIFKLEKNIDVFYVKAESFPEGISAAQEKLHGMVSADNGRQFFGISRPENGKIEYKAAASETHDGEGIEFNCGTMVIKKGEYISLLINDYRNRIESIGDAFQLLTSDTSTDPQGYCVEWYFNENDVRCMIRKA